MAYKSRNKKRSRVPNMRGGFTSNTGGWVRKPGTVARSGGSFKKKSTKQELETTIRRIARGNGSKAAKSLLAAGAVNLVVDIGKTKYRQIIDYPNDPKKGPTVSETTDTQKGFPSQSSLVGAIHKTKWVAGASPVNAIIRNAKQNGKRKLTKYDSAVRPLNTLDRAALFMQSGFNQRAYHWFGTDSLIQLGRKNISPAFWSVEEVGDVINIDPLTVPTLEKEETLGYKTYADTHYFKTRLTLSNSNLFLKSTVKIHMVASCYSLDCIYDKLTLCFNQTLNDQLEGAIPLTHQNGLIETVGSRFTVTTDPKLGSITKSKVFNTDMKIAQTHTKTLAPGEEWQFDYVQQTGSGIRHDKFVQYTRDDGLTKNTQCPAFFFPIIEVVGEQVEMVNSVDSSQRHIGTAPTAITMKSTRTCEYSLGSALVGAAANSPSNIGNYRENIGMRYFIDRETQNPGITLRRFNRDPEWILRPGEAPDVEKFVIPGTSTTDVVWAGIPASGQTTDR